MRRIRTTLAGARLAGQLALSALSGMLAPLAAQSTSAAPVTPAQPAVAAGPATAGPVTAGPVNTGGLVVPAGSRTEDIVLLRGPVDIYGTVDGDVLVASGDVTIHRGAKVTGNATSMFGRVSVLEGGTVAGSLRSMSSTAGQGAAEVVPAVNARPDTWHEVKLVLGWITVLLIIGLGVLVTASPYLDGVAESLEVSFARAIGVGLVGQMLVLPALLAVIVALALTLVGVLAIPLAIVAFVFAAAGLVTLGFLAVAFVTGRSVLGGERGPTKRRASSARFEALRALTLGVCIYLSLWIAAAALTTVPAAAVVLRTIALAATWVAATAGFGAALVSRAGTRTPTGERAPFARDKRPAAADSGAYHSPVPGWQTPTPVHGVVAARRPASSTTPAHRE